jgi:hypothetical protein
MHALEIPAGSTLRLTATARPDAGRHRWSVEVRRGGRAAAAGPPRLVFASEIGGLDSHQRIEIPPQDADCRLEVTGQHVGENGDWLDDRLTVLDDTPDQLDLGLFDPRRPAAHPDDVLLSFACMSPHPQT